jgi:non-heme chloroperoxidase
MPTILTSDGVRLHYVEAGTGKTLLLIGGWTMSIPWWQKQIPELSKRYRVIAVDMRGYGESEKPSYGHRIARHAKDIYDIIEGLDLTDVALLGWSMGASTIFSYLDLFGPHKLSGAILVDQTPKILVDAEWQYGLGEMTAETLMPFIRTIRADYPAFARSFIPTMFTNPPTAAEQAWMLAEMLKMPVASATAVLFDHCNQDWRDRLPTINLPVLVMTGRQSRVFPYQSSVFISEQIPGARLVIFEHSGHCPFYEEAEKFNAAVADFLG